MEDTIPLERSLSGGPHCEPQVTFSDGYSEHDEESESSSPEGMFRRFSHGVGNSWRNWQQRRLNVNAVLAPRVFRYFRFCRLRVSLKVFLKV